MRCPRMLPLRHSQQFFPEHSRGPHRHIHPHCHLFWQEPAFSEPRPCAEDEAHRPRMLAPMYVQLF
jgi:hypothetical protein